MKLTNGIIYFKTPDLEDKENVEEFKQEFEVINAKMYGKGGLSKAKSYEDWLKHLEDNNKAENRVPASQFLVYLCEDDKMVGLVNIRHCLNNVLKERGGHIGHCVRPSLQGRGFGTMQIGLALEFLKTLGVSQVLITCASDNIASMKTILKNGGVEDISNKSSENKKFWIKNI